MSGSEGEVMASVRMGASAGLTLLYTGGIGRSLGSRLAAGVDGRLHLLLGHIQRHVERKAQRDDRGPARAGGRHLRQPGIWPNWRSSGAVTCEVITSGLAPGYSVVTWMVG
jgi:hypothetical protein